MTTAAGGRARAGEGPAGPASAPGEEGPVAPAYLVRGDDPSLVAEAAARLVGELVGDGDPGLMAEDHGPEEDDLGPALDACATPPFLASRRVVVVRDAGRLRAEDVNRVVAYLGDPVATTSLVLVAGGGALSPKLAAAVRRTGHVVDASAPSGRGRAPWLAERVGEGPVCLDGAAAALVDRHLGSDLGRLSGLLDTLGAAYGEGARLGAAEVEPFLGEAGAVMPWELTDAIDGGRTDVALGLLCRLLDAGQRHPLTVAAILNRHYAAMLRLDGADVGSDAEAAEVIGAKSAWAAGKVLTQARRLGSAGVARAVQLLARADLDLRGATALPGPVVLEVLVARLSRLAPRPRAGRSAGRR
ncbi:MAG: DNA polymerase III subunit delta [Acidimicrobiales bacterium]